MPTRLAILVLLACMPAGAWAGSKMSCNVTSVGVDTTQANNSAGVFLGEAIGQSFLASDTLLYAITVWRVAQEDTNAFGVKVYIMKTDSTGMPLARSLIREGPTLVHPFGDKIHPVEFRFTFDPPVQLPGPGLYSFAVQPDPCDGFFDILAHDGGGVYPEGQPWLHSRSVFSGCILRSFPSPQPQFDLVFSVEFCKSTTATISTSWGRLKTLYR